MIDTININTIDFELDIKKNLESKYPLTQIRSYNNSPLVETSRNPVLMYDKNNIEIFGEGLTLARHADNPNGTINKTGIIKIGASPFTDKLGNNPISFSFQCSVPKLLYGENFNLANKEDMKAFLNYTQKTLEDIGIYTNVEKMNVSRLDTTKNIETEYSFNTYIPVLKMCNLTKTSQSEINASTYNVGLGKMKTKQICCYDKLQEIENNGEDIPRELQDKNIFRCEFRNKKKLSIQKVGVYNVLDVINGYGELESTYKKNVEKILFGNFKTPNLEGKQLYNLESMALYNIQNSNRWVDDFIRDIGIQASKESFIQLFDNIESILQIEVEHLESLGKSKDVIKTTKSRHRKKFQEELKKVLAKLDNSYGIPYMQLFDELYNKLLKVA